MMMRVVDITPIIGPAGKASFVYSCMQMILMDQYNGK